MKFAIHAVTAAGLSAIVAWGTGAQAQQVPCACTIPISSWAPGQVVSARGDVLGPRRFGLGSADAGTAIGLGAQVLVGPGSSAQVAFGSCSLLLSENTEMVVSQVGENACVQVSQAGVAAPFGALPVVLGVGGVAGLVGVLALGGGDDGASR